MVQWLVPPAPSQILYPDSDGKPLAENTLQLRWIVVLYSNLGATFQNRADVFIAADLLWYAVEGEPQIRQAPDVMVVFGRPKGERGSYRQWLENGVAPQVVFEILSPGNSATEMADKSAFYEEHGVEEYYVFDPETNKLEVYQRQGDVFRRVRSLDAWVSPRLGIRFDLSVRPMVVYGPDGQPFRTLEEEKALSQNERDKANEAKQEADRAKQEISQLQTKNARLIQKLRELGIDPDSLKGE
jgi:Uma2 family endonuclease